MCLIGVCLSCIRNYLLSDPVELTVDGCVRQIRELTVDGCVHQIREPQFCILHLKTLLYAHVQVIK